MVYRLTKHVSRRRTSPREAASPEQARNSAGGYSFVLSDRDRLERFLILGSEGGSYYASERKLSIDNAQCLARCLDADGIGTVEQIAAMSEAGRAPKNGPAIFALAFASAHEDPDTRRAALEALPRVCRTASHLFEFVDSVGHFRGWGRSLRRAVAHWYTKKDPRRLAYQVVKYRQRHGWSHHDVLRKAGGAIGPHSSEHEAVLRWAVDGLAGFDRERVVARGEQHSSYGAIARDQLPELIEAVEQLSLCREPERAAQLIRTHRLTHEMVPGELKAHPPIWEALLEHMPVGAMLRSLGKLTQVGTVAASNAGTQHVLAALSDPARLAKARLHPLSVLTALRIYARGRGHRGKLSWEPVRPIIDALDAAFYTCFDNVVPANKRTLLALDVSGSMGCGELAGLPGISPLVGTAAMSLVTAATEASVEFIAFSTQIKHLGLLAGNRLEQVVTRLQGIPMGGTNCALPMIWAQEKKLEVDTFVVYTDNETWFGDIHPHQALCEYRKHMGIAAKLIVVGMTATQFSIADPNDAGMLDVVGFDSAAPALMANFSR